MEYSATNKHPVYRLGLVAGLLVLLSACASTKPPTEKMTRTQVAIQQAEQVGARDYAPLELRNARKKLDDARDLMKNEKYEKASRLAEEAQVDAELAETKSLSEKAQRAVRELRKSIQALKEEINRNQQNH